MLLKAGVALGLSFAMQRRRYLSAGLQLPSLSADPCVAKLAQK
jgi:hypothetical protein